MDAIDQKLEAYQLELSQVRNRQRDAENRAREHGQLAAVIQAKIQGILEAKEIFESGSTDAAKPKPRERQRHRPLSTAWKAIMNMAHDKGEFDYDDLGKFATAIAHPIGRDTLRSQMSGYKTLGFVEGLGGGRFRVLEAGCIAAGINVSGAPAPKEIEPSSAIAVGSKPTGWSVQPPSPVSSNPPAGWPS